jgi:hypothetical protein
MKQSIARTGQIYTSYGKDTDPVTESGKKRRKLTFRKYVHLSQSAFRVWFKLSEHSLDVYVVPLGPLEHSLDDVLGTLRGELSAVETLKELAHRNWESFGKAANKKDALLLEDAFVEDEKEILQGCIVNHARMLYMLQLLGTVIQLSEDQGRAEGIWEAN